MENNQYQQAVKEAVKGKFKGKRTLAAKNAPRFPASAEREMRRITIEYNNILRQELKKGLPKVMNEYKKLRHNDSRFDDARDLERLIRELFLDIAEAIEKRISEFDLQYRLARVGELARKTALREWKRMVRETLGVNLLDDYYNGSFYAESIDQWVSDNVLKIKSIPAGMLDDMRQIITEGYMEGATIRDIQSRIQAEYNSNKSYAQFLARDQVATLNAQITQAQQRDAGVSRYKWSDSRDSRVRECHREFDGKIFSWDDPPEGWYYTKSKGRVYTGRKCHPGEDIGCRCVAIPVFDIDGIQIPMKGKSK